MMTTALMRLAQPVLAGWLLGLFFATDALASSCSIAPATPVSGQTVTVTYGKAGGPLASASTIYIHRGNNGWAHISSDRVMTFNAATGLYTFSYSVSEVAYQANFAFTDGAGTWDSNNGANWNFTVTPGTPPATIPEAILPTATSRANVMMQGFYWNVPEGNWYNSMAFQAAALRNMERGQGIDRIWFPPPSKGATGATSMGYDPYDYYDLGAFNQLGSVRGRFGTQAQLRSAVSAFKAQGILCLTDAVLNHRSGGAAEPNLNLGGATTFTNYSSVASGKCTWRYNQFHPSTFESYDDDSFANFSDVCHVTGSTAGSAPFDLMEWGQWLMDPANAGFDGGWRFDYVAGYRPSFTANFRAATGNSFGILEYWKETNMVQLDRYVAYSGGTRVFDFPGYYALRDICNNPTGGGNIANLVNTNVVYAARNPGKAVTFCANHDIDEIASNKMLAYAFLLTYQGYPCIFWKDYFENGLATFGGQAGNGIKRLVWVRGALGGGHPTIQVLKSNDPDLLIYGTLNGTNTTPGYLVVLNDHSTAGKGATVTTSNPALQGKTLRCYAWYSYAGGQNAQPANVTSDATGVVTVQAPARGYAVYGPEEPVTLLPDPPVKGQTTTITYNAAGRNLAGAAQVYAQVSHSGGSDTIWPAPAMTNIGPNRWSYTYNVPSAASAVDVTFSDGTGIDDNGGVGWHFVTNNPPPVTLLEDGFETDFTKWTDGVATDWDRSTTQKVTGNYSAHAGSPDNDLISDNLNTSGYASLTVEFWYRDDDFDPGDAALQFFNGTALATKFDLNLATEDTWVFHRTTIFNSGSDAQYFRSNFRIALEATPLGNGENLWIDDVRVTAEPVLNPPPAPTLAPGQPVLSHGYSYEVGTSVTFTWNQVPAENGVVPSYRVTVVINGETATFVTAGTSFTVFGEIGDHISIAVQAVHPSDTSSAGPLGPSSAAIRLIDGNADEDHDGATNAAERVAGTNALDAGSLFRVLSLTAPTPDSHTITWTSVPGRNYRVRWTTDLITGFSDPANASPIIPASANTATSWTDTAAASRRVYRVEVIP